MKFFWREITVIRIYDFKEIKGFLEEYSTMCTMWDIESTRITRNQSHSLRLLHQQSCTNFAAACRQKYSIEG